MKKIFGDLTLSEIVEINNKRCPVSSCRECREKHSADYAVCQLDIYYDIDKLDLNQEVEVEE